MKGILIDLTGQRFGRLTVIGRAPIDRTKASRASRWHVSCDCGKERIAQAQSLKSGHTRSCGCIPPGNPAVDLTGQKFGRWTVTGRAPCKPGHKGPRWFVRCECGTEKSVRSDQLQNGESKSCGCASPRFSSDTVSTHRQSRTREYRTWCNMRGRCKFENAPYYKHYGARGITVCREWANSFESFFADMGPRPSPKYSIDRKDNDGHYSCGHCQECVSNGWPANCHWTTQSEQVKNRRPYRRKKHTARNV